MLCNPRHFGFDPSRFHSDSAAPFRAVLKRLVGANGPSCAPILSSLWCELVFNDCRDAERRANKKEEVSAVQCHAVACKSVVNRAGKLPKQEPVLLSDADWAIDLPGKTMKAGVFSSPRVTDKTIGLDTSGLTRSKHNSSLTKPHIFQQRLCLMKHLVTQFWQAKDAGLEFDVALEIRKKWINQLFLPDFFVTWSGREEADRLLIIGKNPYSTTCYKLSPRGDLWAPDPSDFGVNKFEEFSFQDFDSIQVAATETCLDQGGNDVPCLAWKQTTDWMSLGRFVCEYLVLTISASLLTAVCRQLKIKGYTRFSHRERCRMVMEECGYNSAFIDEIYNLLPETRTRKSKEKDTEVCVFT